MPNVALVFEYPTLFGGEMSLLAMLPALQAAGFDLHAIAPSDSPLAESLAASGVAVQPFAWRNGDRRRPLGELRAELVQQIRDVGTDLIHANSLSAGRIVGPVAVERGIPSIAHLRDIVGLSAQAVADLNDNTRLLAVSRATREFHLAQGIEAAKTTLLYNGVDLEKFRPRAPSGWLHDELAIPRDVHLIGNIGQFSLRKGQDVYLEAAEAIAQRREDVHFLLIGARFSVKGESQRYEDQLRSRADEGILAGRVHFLGIRSDVAQLLPELSLLLHTARQEPLGRVLLEAAACGLPIVATNVGGTGEIFPADACAAIPVEPDDPTTAAVQAVTILNDAAFKEILGAAARKRIENTFDADLAGEALADIYRATLGRVTL